jgi:hypothetical protein
LVPAIGGVTGFTYFLYRQHLDEAKLFKELFAEFNARYDALNNDLNTILFGPPEGSLSADEKEHLSATSISARRSIYSIRPVILTGVFGNHGIEA